MATFIERCIDPYAEGGQINIDILKVFLVLTSTGDINTAYIVDYFSLDAGQQSEFVEIMATSQGHVVDRVQWVARLYSLLFCGGQGYTGFSTANEIRVLLGLAEL